MLRPWARSAGSRGEQAEIARVLRNLLPRPPIDHQVEGFDRKAEKPWLVLAVGLGGVDDIVASIEPMADQRLDQGRRMLAVAVHEQDGAETGMIEAGRERRFLAEIARQRDDLKIDRGGRERPRHRKGGVAAAVVHIHDLDHEPARRVQPPRPLDDTTMQRGEPGRLVVDRNHDRKPGLRTGAQPGRSLGPACEVDRIGRHCACLSGLIRALFPLLGPTPHTSPGRTGCRVAPLCILSHLRGGKRR